MMCPSFLLLCPCLTSHLSLNIRIYNTKPRNFLSLPIHSFFQELFLHLSLSLFPSVIHRFCKHTSCVHLMNRTNGDFTPSNLNPLEDPKVRLRHHSLMQDYRELHMDTEAMRKKLQTMRERKATLMAEVRFLRRRYRHLRQDQPVMQPPDLKKGRGRSNGAKKSKTQIRVAVSPRKRSEAEAKHVSLPDLNHSGNVHDETKTSLMKKVPLFDLNQISGEEEEETEAVNNSEERMRVEESSSCKRMSSSMEMQQQKEMKLSSCRNGGNGSNKRKISWQDPVAALRV